MNNRASNEELDRVLTGDDGIVPSSGFASSVMEAVRRNTDAPRPIPFPWKRALPGFIVCLTCAAILLLKGGSSDVTPGISVIGQEPLGWILAALVVTLLSVMLSLRLMGNRM